MTALLLNSPTEIIAQLIINLGKGTDAGTYPVFADFAPESPDNLISVHTNASRMGPKDMVEGDVAEAFGFQVAVRSATFSSGEQKARDIANTFDPIQNKQVTYDGNVYIVTSITRRTGVLNPTRNLEDSRRNLFTTNYTTFIRQE
jgi:hypothetical protein|tara:strand:- start:5337 stop:5771 length:435 start_codon:yes stop_codon:yes gene_type:complete